MSRQLAVNLVLAALVAALGAFLLLKPQRAADEAFPLSALRPEQVTAIRIEKPGHAAVVLERQGDGWRLMAPLAGRGDSVRVERLLELLSARSRQRLPAVDLARFELDRPLAIVTLGGEAFAFGTVAPVTQEQYLLAGGMVHLVSTRHAADALLPPAQLLSHRLLAEAETPVGFELPGLALRQRDGQWQAVPERGLSQDELNRWVNEWRLATSLQSRPRAPGEALAELRIELAGGTTIPLKLLQREPETVLLRADENIQYHFPARVGARLLDPGR